MKPQDPYRVLLIAFRAFFVVFAVNIALQTTRAGFRSLAPFLGQKSLLRYIGIPDMAALLAVAFIIAAPVAVHFLVKDYILVNYVIHHLANPQNTRRFLWTFALGVIAVDGVTFYWGIAEQTFWGEVVSRAPAIILTIAYILIFPMFGFIDLVLSLKARS